MKSPESHDPAGHVAQSPFSPVPPARAVRLTRRVFLAGTGLVAGSACARWAWEWNERFLRADVAVLRATGYHDQLPSTLEDGLRQLGIGPEWARKRSVLRETGVPYVDLNHDDLFTKKNALGLTDLGEFHLPRTLLRADRIVSMGKIKTHHWAGVTLSMKNLFGVLPGIGYGWPKNVLHRLGIDASILDITATIRPDLAILDGIVGMEGDGPIMGAPKRLGALVLGKNPAAVDATAARLMGFDPHRIPHLRAASGKLGPIAAAHIRQRGEPLDGLVVPFRRVDHPLMKRFRG